MLEDTNSLVAAHTKFRSPARFIATVQQFHDAMSARVQNDREYSETFPVTNRLNQDSALVPTLFSMVFFVLLTDAFQDCDAGFPI